jgi:RimJ/RimL family protein N-acetyltransferase
VADGLIAGCLERCREHGATQLVWQTAVDNHRAQAVNERLGATREDRWLDYQLPVDPG